jgi:hypothetical protein
MVKQLIRSCQNSARCNNSVLGENALAASVSIKACMPRRCHSTALRSASSVLYSEPINTSNAAAIDVEDLRSRSRIAVLSSPKSRPRCRNVSGFSRLKLIASVAAIDKAWNSRGSAHVPQSSNFMPWNRTLPKSATLNTGSPARHISAIQVSCAYSTEIVVRTMPQ